MVELYFFIRITLFLLWAALVAAILDKVTKGRK